MNPRRRLWLTGGLSLASAAGLIGVLFAYPGGTPQIVTNAGPYCATCHSSASPEQVRNMPPEAAGRLAPEKRHLSEITAGEENYGKLQPADREKLVEHIKAVDANSKVALSVSAVAVKPDAPLTVTVTTHGGGGPVVGVMLTDNDLRFQSSPVQVEGFEITAAPKVIGPDGAEQTKFLDGRFGELAKNINYVNIQNVHSDPVKGVYPECKVVYTLRAPARAGEYTMSAAFLYGTEKASPLGRVETPDGRAVPLGGGGAHSGRIQFAKLVKIKVT